MPSMSSVAAARATAVVTSQLRNLITPVSLSGHPERLDDLLLGVGEVQNQEVVRRVEVFALEEPDQGRVRVGLVVGVAPDPVDLSERELELDDQVLLHGDQPR